jgi:uncharacterized protein (TIGR03083 family)
VELSHDELDALLGAYAVDALEAVERDEVEAMIEADPELARRVAGFHEAAVGLLAATTPELTPPGALRSTVLGHVGGARPRPRHITNFLGSGLAPIELWRRQFGELDPLLDELDGADWDATTSFQRSVHELLAHLTAVLDLFATEIGAESAYDIPEGTPVGHWELTEPRIAELAGRPPADTVATLRASAARIDRRLASLSEAELTAVTEGRILTLADRTRQQCFELWMHSDDVRGATGRALVDPDPERVCALSDLSARHLGLGMFAVDRQHAGSVGRLVLTGAGGGTWLTPLALEEASPDAPEVVTVVVDALDYCRLVGRLLTIDELTFEAEGDAAAGLDLLHGAQAFAV